jgi:rhodanese-related sulfurtransferase
MKAPCSLLVGLLVASLSGCKSDAAKVADSGIADGPAAAADSVPDGPGLPQRDAGSIADEPTGGDTRTSDSGVRDAVADQIAPTDPIATETKGAEAPAGDAPAADVPGDLLRDKPAVADAAGDVPGAGDAGCAGWTTLARLSPAEAKELIATTDPIVINVHIPYEGDIPGTDTSIPYDDVDAIEDYLAHDHCADLLLVCRSDHMSQIAGDELVKRGYLRVRDLKGGFIAWQNAGYPLLKDGGT